MWFIYTIEYYSSINNKDILSFAGKWMMELENIILSGVTLSQKDMHGMYSNKCILEKRHKEYLGYDPWNSRRLTS